MGVSSRSSFFGFEIAKTGLFINQHNLNVTGHNISNVNTPGYTRQRLVTSAIEPYSSIGKLAPLENGLLGGGVRSHYIEQLRSAYLDRQYRGQNANQNTWMTRTTNLEFLEQIFDEPDEVGVLDMLLKDFYNSISDLQVNSNSQAAREVVKSNAQKLTDTFNQFYRQMVDLQTNINKEVESKVEQVNQLTEQICSLNKLIYNSEMNGEHANDLRDQRNLALDQLSSLVEIEVHEYKNHPDEPARLQVSIGTGASKGYLVDHKDINKLVTGSVANSVKEDTTDAPNVTGHPEATVLTIMWDDGAYITPAGTTKPSANTTLSSVTTATIRNMYNLTGHGEINGLLSLRDGSTQNDAGLPFFIEQLNKLARSITLEFNTVHSQGYTHPNSGSPSTDGINFFKEFGTFNVTAGNFQISDDILDSVWNIACSSEEVKLGENEGNNVNTLVQLLALLDSKTLSQVPGVSNFGEFYRGFLVNIGTATSFSRKEATSSVVLADSIDSQRMSISAVSIDEEMTNLIRFQHAYAASSRVITTMDEALEKLINGTGIVGR